MIDTLLDKSITEITVRIKTEGGVPIGSGTLLFQEHFSDKVYILTASHCLFEDGDSFQLLRSTVKVDILRPGMTDFHTFSVIVRTELLFREESKDVAILILDKSEVEAICGTLPTLSCVRERSTVNQFVTKGFPRATKNQEIVSLYPQWSQDLEKRFQLQMNENYTSSYVQGFSGGGIFMAQYNTVELLGVFTRFRDEERGKIIYCQYLDTVNEILESNYLPAIVFSYYGNFGLRENFFRTEVQRAVKGLGPRFTEELNLRLPIAEHFNAIAKDSNFFSKLSKITDNWILNKGYHRTTDNPYISDIENHYTQVKEQAKDWMTFVLAEPMIDLDVQWMDKEISDLFQKIDRKSAELYSMRVAEEKINPPRPNDPSNHRAYSSEIGRLREIKSATEDFQYELRHKVNIQLANNPVLIVKGEAGNGKSHLLGDVAKTRISRNLPTLLILGQNLSASRSLWDNILQEIDLRCSSTELLQELNSIGRQTGSRLLIMVDAINEGPGNELWFTRIASFISDFKQYPYVGLVLTIRSTYLDYVIPQEVLKDPAICVVDHQGFKGNEYAALKLFCEHHDLKQPNFPILAPEFSKPLFLKLICEAVKEMPDKSFPQGFQGISDIFRLYIESQNVRFERKREVYKNRKIVEKAILKLAHACFGKEARSLAVDQAHALFDLEFPGYGMLLTDLIEENLVIKKVQRDYTSNKSEEVIYFSYERLGDYFIAEDLLSKYTNLTDLKASFARKAELGKLISYHYWEYRGLIEAFAVLLPEKYQLELFEVFDWVFVDGNAKDFELTGYKEDLNRFLFDSLNFRKIDSIDNEKITSWFRSKYFRLDSDEQFLKLVELSPIAGHPFNADRLFRILKREKMPKRDAFWLQHIRHFKGYDDNDFAFPIRRLIDWAWSPEISSKLDLETARLTGMTLTWLLASTDRKLRDEATKAMVNLLEQQPDALLSILKAFKTIDDMYILERLYAICYGCVLRTKNRDNILAIAKVVYAYVFSKKNPPKHLLLRDYARNIIEYASYTIPASKFNLEAMRPPYTSKMPEMFPSEQDIAKFELDTEDPNIERQHGRMNNMIRFSVMDWDFGRYTVNSALNHFYSVPFTFDADFATYSQTLSRPQRGWLNQYASFAKTYTKMSQRRHHVHTDDYKKFMEIFEDFKRRLLENGEQLFGDEMKHLRHTILPLLEKRQQKKNRSYNSLEGEPVKRWIVNRVFELGYDHKIHGSYDYSTEGNRSENKVERIGKKYQWIALFEILAAVTDNYKLYDDWVEKTSFYKGPWQLYLRDVDPAFTTRNPEDDEDEEQTGEALATQSWTELPYNNWNQNDYDWVRNMADLPQPTVFINLTDLEGRQWLSLERTGKWKQPKQIGQDHYTDRKKQVVYYLQAYLVKRKDIPKVKQLLSGKNLSDFDFPESENLINLINREKFWSPAYFDMENDKAWRQLDGTPLKIIQASTTAVGEMSGDKSNAHSYYDMPARTIFEGMALRYAPRDGEFTDCNGRIVVKDIGYKNLLIGKDELHEFLKRERLDIFWTLTGEKNSFSMGDREHNHYKYISGLYFLENGKISGQLTLHNRH